MTTESAWSQLFGIKPDKWLYDRLRLTRLSVMIPVGNDPTKPFPVRYKVFKLGRSVNKHAGIDPVIAVPTFVNNLPHVWQLLRSKLARNCRIYNFVSPLENEERQMQSSS